jgi:hypothetical protein
MHFGFDGIMLDPGGGGNWIRPELAKVKQIIRDVEVKVVPIACAEDEADTMVAGKFILCMFKATDLKVDALWGHMGARHSDNLNDQAHTEFQEAWANNLLGMPKRFKDMPGSETDMWPDEKKWANRLLDLMAIQLPAITVQINPDGTTYYSAHRARAFSSKGRKDFAYAGLMAYTRFLCWLKTHEDGFGTNKEDEDGIC